MLERLESGCHGNILCFCHRGCSTHNVAGTSKYHLVLCWQRGECCFLGHKKETTTLLLSNSNTPPTLSATTAASRRCCALFPARPPARPPARIKYQVSMRGAAKDYRMQTRKQCLSWFVACPSSTDKRPHGLIAVYVPAWEQFLHLACVT